jgi:hypothetical protein
MLKKNDTEVVPRINYLDFVDTKWFGEKRIDTCNISHLSKAEEESMEMFAKAASVLFVPHRKLSDLKGENGDFLMGFRKFLMNPPKRFVDFHQQILKNIQDCRNSMNAGRPLDALERDTIKPIQENLIPCCEEEKDDIEFNDMYQSFLSNFENIFSENTGFRTKDKILSFDSSIIRDSGSLNCGRTLLKMPPQSFGRNSKILIEAEMETENNNETIPFARNNRTIEERIKDRENLYVLSLTMTERLIDNSGNITTIKPTGNVRNIREYAQHVLGSDEDQKKAFELIVAAFIVELYKTPVKLPSKRRYNAHETVRQLKKLNHGGQFVAFLSGPGGTGKSKVLNTVLCYCKELCRRAKIPFNKRTITVTALTGAAAVSIRGETTHSACGLRSTTLKTERIHEWEDTKMLIIDEISFANEKTLKDINDKLNQLKQSGNESRFGNIPIVFTGDFTQLEPVKAKPLFLNTENELWYNTVSTFIELRTNHRFKKDPEWGKQLARMRENGSTEADLRKINSRVVCLENNLYDSNIPQDAIYVTKSNIDKAAINDGLFAMFISKTHSKSKRIEPPLHTICIKASNLLFKKNGTTKVYSEVLNQYAADMIYAACGDGHVKSSDGKRYDPLLKLYKNRPLCINENINVPNCIANGAMCLFKGIVLENEDSIHCIEKIMIDGYYVNCINASDVKFLVVEMQDGNESEENPKIIHLELQSITASIHLPIPWDGPIHKNTRRIWNKIKFDQFPVNVANARTAHKLQGRSVNNLVVTNWDYKGNWVYVVLSRCSTLNGIFLKKPLLKMRPMSKECKLFHAKFRDEKQAPEYEWVD